MSKLTYPIVFDTSNPDQCTGSGTLDDPYIVWPCTICKNERRKKCDDLAREFAIEHGWTVIHIRGADHTTMGCFINGDWVRIPCDNHFSFLGGVSEETGLPLWEGDLFIVTQPDGTYRRMRDDERRDTSGRLNRQLFGVEMGRFNQNRQTRDRKSQRGVVQANSAPIPNHTRNRSHGSGSNLRTIAEQEDVDATRVSSSWDAAPAVAPEPLTDAWGAPIEPERPAVTTSTQRRHSLATDTTALVTALIPPFRPPAGVMQAEASAPPARASSWATMARRDPSSSSSASIDIASKTSKSKWRSFKD